MLRDFSEENKQRLTGLINEVGNANQPTVFDWSTFIWSGFDTWVGQLGIRQNLDNVTAYNNKVNEKNNASIGKLSSIFSDIKSIDNKYIVKYNNLEKLLSDYLKYIIAMEDLISPSNGKFSVANINKKMSLADKVLILSSVSVKNGTSKDRNVLIAFMLGLTEYFGTAGEVINPAIRIISKWIETGTVNFVTPDEIMTLAKSGIKSLTGLNKWQVDKVKLGKLARMLPNQAKLTWWKRFLGLNDAFKGPVSVAANWTTRFGYDFKAQISKYYEGFKFSKGTNIGASLKWLGVAATGLFNGISNNEEYGEMTGRAWVETISETAIDIGTQAAVYAGTAAAMAATAAGIAAVAGTAPVSVPVLAVAAVSAGVIFVGDEITKYLTKKYGGEEKRLTELISDSAIDFGTAAVDGVKQAYKEVSKVAVNSFDAVTDSVTAAVDGVKQAYKEASNVAVNCFNNVTDSVTAGLGKLLNL